MKNWLKSSGRALALACAAVGMLAALPIQAEDSSVQRRLDSVGQKYEVDKDGDFKLSFSFKEDKRTQIVFIKGTSSEMAGITVRNVFAPVAMVDKDDIARTALDLLKASNGYKAGAFEIEGNYVLFSMKVPDTADGQQLKRAAELVAIIADEKEKDISGTRDTF